MFTQILTMKKATYFLAALLTTITVISCKKNDTKITCDGSNPTYTSYVKNLVDNNCVSCHSNFATYSGLSTVTTNGKFEQKVLIEQSMPKNGSLSTEELKKLQCWVDNGFPEN